MRTPSFYRTLITFVAFDNEAFTFKVKLPGWDGNRKKVKLDYFLVDEKVRGEILELFGKHKKVRTFGEVTIGVEKAKDLQFKDIEMPGDQYVPTWEEILNRGKD